MESVPLVLIFYEAVCISLDANDFDKGMNPNVLPQDMSKQ